MNRLNKLARSAACLTALLLASPTLAGDMRSAVVSAGNSAVVSSSGACVRTKWQSGSDACAQKQAQATAAKKQAPVATIEKDQRTVYFNFNEAELRPDAIKALDQLADLIRANGTVTKIHVVGYADPIGGSSRKNIALSQKRADAVKDYLAGKLQIPSDATVRDLGVSHTAECSKKEHRNRRIECLQPDRRVEVELYKEE